MVPRSPTFKVLTQDPKKREKVESFYLELNISNLQSMPILLVTVL
jgi:hypothetical protein